MQPCIVHTVADPGFFEGEVQHKIKYSGGGCAHGKKKKKKNFAMPRPLLVKPCPVYMLVCRAVERGGDWKRVSQQVKEICEIRILFHSEFLVSFK